MWIALLTLACKDDTFSQDAASDTGSAAYYGGDADEAADSGGWGGDGGDGGDGGADMADTGDASEPEEDPTDTADTAEPPCEPAEPQLLWVSPDDSNSMSSATQIREAVLGGSLNLNQVQVRDYELMNYYDLGYPEPSDAPVGLDMELVQDGDRYRLQVGVTAPAITHAERAPMNVVLVLDTSGSMSGEPIDLLREVSLEIAGQLQEGDVVSVNEWSSSSSVVLKEHMVSGPSDADLVDALSALESGGGTDLAGGLSVGYDLAAQQYADDRINRVVLVSDGGANLGVTSEELIGEMAGDENAVGIYLVGVGVGDATSYDDKLMDEVTDLGKGASVFVADSGDVEAFFGDRFLELMDVAARNVEVAVELPGGFEIVRTSAEEVSTERSEVPPQHLAPGASMVTHSLLEHCDADALAMDEQVSVTVSWQDPWTLESSMLSYDATLEELLALPASASLTKGAAIVAYADAIREVRSTSSRELLGEALDRIGTAEADNPGDAELAEMRAILEAL